MKRFLLLFVFLWAHTLLFGQGINVDFSYDKTIGCGPLTVSFQDLSTGPNPITAWLWNFGDGNNSTLQNPVHIYTKKGSFRVSLTVWDNMGNKAVKDDYYFPQIISVQPSLNIGDEYLLCNIYSGPPSVRITNKGAGSYGDTFGTYRWSTGDTTSSIMVNAPGTYSVTYEACGQTLQDDANVSLTTAKTQVTVDPAATYWDYGFYKRTLNVSIPYSRQAIDRFFIDWKDGKIDTITSPYSILNGNQFYHHYTKPGSYQTTFTTRLKEDDRGYCDTLQSTLVYVRTPAVAVELGNDTTIFRGDTLVLDAGNPGAQYIWREETTQTIKVTKAGQYRVTVIKNGDLAQDSIKVSVIDGPPSVRARMGIMARSCNTIYFADSSFVSNGQANQWYWVFGDGTTDTVQNPVHTYPANEPYTVKLYVSANNGHTDSTTRTIVPVEIPPVDLGPDVMLARGDTVTLTQYSSGKPQYLWSTGDTTKTIKVTAPGTYWLRMTYCVGSVADTINILADTTIINNPTAQFTSDKPQCTTVRFTDQSTTTAGTTIASRYWSFGDNTTDTAQNPLHTYSQRGEYTVSLVVVNSAGKRDTATTTLYFAPLLVDLGADTTLAAAGDSLLLDARKPDNSGDAYLWSTGSTQPVIVVYTSGSYWVKVTTCGTTVTDTITVTIPAVPPASSGLQAGFGFLQTGCRTYRFTDTSKITTGSISHWAWQFGDNTTDTLPNPVHTYSQPGNYIVTLVVTDNSGKQDTAIKLIINTAIAVSLGQDIDTLRPGGSIRLSAPYPAGSHYSFHWSTGDTTAAITITQPGTYALRVSDWWCGTSAADTINISFANPAGINAAIGIQGRNCTSVHFLDESTTLQPIVKWQWSFGDGTTDTTQNPQHLYASDGQYLVTLVVTDSQGATDTATRNVELNNKPNLELGADISLHLGDTVMLGADFPNTTRTWSTGETGPVIAITTPGTYSVTVYYCNGSVSDTIHVYADSIPAKLEAKFVADKLQCTTVKFTNQSTTSAGTTIISRQWSFGDNTTDTAQSPVHTYSQRGTYTVSLLIVNSAGQRDTAFTTIYFAPVLVNLGADTTLAAGSSLLLDARKPNNSGDTYLWSTGATTPTITVTQAGTYWVKVSACNTVVTDTIRITQPVEPENPASVGNTTTVNANDSLAITASFDHSFNGNNIFTIQLLQGTNTGGKKAGELDGTVTNLATISGTNPRISVKVSMPDTIPCGQDYRVRIVSSSPADTTDWSSKFAVVNTPVATLQQRGDSLFAGKALTYQWYFNGAALTSATTAAIRAKANGQYYVMVSNGGTCRSTSTTVSMVITAVPDITVGENVVRAFPNPTAGLVYVRFEKPLLKPVDLIVHDAKGNTLYRRQVKDQLTEIDLGTLPKGIYYLEVAGYGKQKAMRIILQ